MSIHKRVLSSYIHSDSWIKQVSVKLEASKVQNEETGRSSHENGNKHGMGSYK